MILRPDDLQAVCNNFNSEIFKPAWDNFNKWVDSTFSTKLLDLGESMYFVREGKVWPGPIARDFVKPLHPSLCPIFDEKYDEMRQMVDIEGNYYEHLLRNAISVSNNKTELHELIPKAAHKYIWDFGDDAPSQLTEAKELSFISDNQIALNYLKKRLAFYSIGVNAGLI